MKSTLFRFSCVVGALAVVVAFGAPQVGQRKGNDHGSSGGGGGSHGGGNSGGNQQQHHNNPPPQNGTNHSGQGWQHGSWQGSPHNGSHSGQSGGDQHTSGVPLNLHRVNSRSGIVNYHGYSNNTIQVGSTRIYLPNHVISPGMNRRIGGERPGLVNNGWRVGYHHYNQWWRDDDFVYPFYVFDPYGSRVVCSPWYFYPSCPPYLNSTRIIVITSGWPSYGWVGQRYAWHQPNWDDRYAHYTDIDYAVDDIVRSFEQGDVRAAQHLVPSGGNVHLYFDGHYGYSVSASDFYDLFMDGIQNVHTTHYEVTDVQNDGHGNMHVSATQTFVDPWGQETTAYHTYFLVNEDGNWVIREFGTSSSRE